MGNPHAAPREVVILVHGTFNSSPDDTGEQWWQRGSPFWVWLRDNLPNGVELLEEGRLFHWSGDNAESAREAAAHELLAYVKQFDDLGVGYHIVAHSHGGSVVLNMLQINQFFRRNYRHWKTGDFGNLTPGLRSWTTVGTPFLVPERRRATLVYMLAALICFVIWTVSTHLPTPLQSATPMVPRVALWLGVALIVFSAIDDAGRTRWGNRWFGLWSSQDEAIDALRSAQRQDTASLKIIPRQKVGLGPWRFGLRVFVEAVVRALVAPVANVLAPIGDRFVWASIRDAIHGNNRPGFHVKWVSTDPVGLSSRFPNAWQAGYSKDAPFLPPAGLPREVDSEIIARANANAQRSLPTVRRMLGRIASRAPLGLFRIGMPESISGDELVHWLYFDTAAVRHLICAHIRISSAHYDELRDTADDAIAWLRE